MYRKQPSEEETGNHVMRTGNGNAGHDAMKETNKHGGQGQSGIQLEKLTTSQNVR